MEKKQLLELEFNVDDMTGEQISFAIERFYEAGALDAYTVAIGMKKSRPGFLVHVSCRRGERDAMLAAIFKYTETIGVREREAVGYAMESRIETAKSPFGDLHRKVSEGFGVTRIKYEHEDLARVAKERECTLDEALEFVKGRFSQS